MAGLCKWSECAVAGCVEIIMMRELRFKIFRFINIGLSVVFLAVLFIDFIVVNEFHIERGFLDILTVLLVLNIIRLSVWYHSKKWLFGVLISLGILGFLLCIIYVLPILFFGIGYSGRETPIIMTISVIVTFLFIPVLFQEIFRLLRN